ncbi:MAG: hypothetical protein OEV49_02230 [candidate division Zixibacteria bacterium]|nr:hypothetical protein [candidate division Zixibacteria bacterium]MDH3936068.1 hypothetical protein [candidate division Zixibacteria bacterium]MDH4032735.1 hypothetical protein [candidate division Zixibacteria bacterium]
MFIKRLPVNSLLVAAALLITSAFGAESPPTKEQSLAPGIMSGTYGYTDHDKTVRGWADQRPSERLSLGSPSLTSPFVGTKIGDTYFDQQHFGRMARMVDWGNDVAGGAGFMIHFEWMRLATEVNENRHYTYNVYYAGGGQAGTTLGQVKIQPDGEYAGYVSLDVTNDGRAVLGGHNNQGSGDQAHTYWDFGPGFAFYGMNRHVPDSVLAAGLNCAPTDSLKSAIWPSIRYQEGPADDVLHVFTQVRQENQGDPQALIYFRKVGSDDTGEWDYPPFVVDTVFDIAQDVACSNVDGKVALVWIANLPDPGDCDTCSSQNGRPFVQWDNDIYYQISHDYGATFSPSVNLTMNVDGEEGYRPYTDLSALMGSDNNLRIAWNGRFWPADANQGGEAGLLRCRMQYWGENLGTGGYDLGGDPIIRTVSSLEWDQTDCNGGVWQLNGAKMTISECDGKLYYLWTQFNDVPAGVEDDCAERAYGENPEIYGSANGELYFSVSADGGLTWDQAHNLTNTYTPHCDPGAGVDSACRSEHWASMARFGTNLSGDMSGAYVLDPSGGYTGDYFLDVQYIGDKDPGSIVYLEGSWQQADVMWFRLPCIEPNATPCLASSLYRIGWPTHTNHGVPLDTPLVLENPCPEDANFTLTVREYTGPPGWLTTSGLESGVVPSGGAPLEGTISLNSGGIVNQPPTDVYLSGALILDGNFVGSPDTLPIECWVTDGFVDMFPDTISTACLSLVVSNNGNFGNQGMGRVNMDFFNSGDCDTVDSIPGGTDIYLYDGSPVICWQDGDTIRCNYSIYGQGITGPNGFIQTAYEPPVDSGDIYFYRSEFITRDSGLGLIHSWYAPKDQPTRCQYLIHRLQVFSNDGQTHPGLAIGEFVDWDIPADSGIRNNSGFRQAERLIYQQGSEYNDDDGIECQENSDRYGGISLLEIREISGGNTVTTTDPYGAYTADNATQVYPTGGLVPDSIWHYIGVNEGYVMSPSTDADLHSVMTYKYNYTLAPTDTIDIFTMLTTTRFGFADFITSVQEGQDWHCERVSPDTCGGTPDAICGDMNGDGAYDLSDMTYIVDYIYTGGPGPVGGFDTDGYDRWTLYDKYLLFWGLFCYYWPDVYCADSVGPPLGQALTSDVLLYLSNYSFPANTTTIMLDVWVDTDPGLRFAVMPFNVRVDGEIPAANLNPVDDAFRQNARDSANGIVQVDMFNPSCLLGIGAGRYHAAQLELVMPTPSSSEREIVIAWDSLETREEHHPFVIMSDGSNWRPTIKTSGPCCVGPMRGNVDCGGNNEIDIADLVWMVDYMFTGGPLCCFDETDINGDGTIDIADLVCMVEYMFSNPSECEPAACPLSEPPQ